MNDFLDKFDLTIGEITAEIAANALIKWAKQQAQMIALIETDLDPSVQLYPKLKKWRET